MSLALLLGMVILVAPGLASACDGCLAAQSDSVQRAFIVASAFISVLPLAMVGGGVWWLRRRAQKLAAEEAAGVIHLPVPSRTRRRA
jgi:predicted cobalt transporter CbtA